MPLWATFWAGLISSKIKSLKQRVEVYLGGGPLRHYFLRISVGYTDLSYPVSYHPATDCFLAKIPTPNYDFRLCLGANFFIVLKQKLKISLPTFERLLFFHMR